MTASDGHIYLLLAVAALLGLLLLWRLARRLRRGPPRRPGFFRRTGWPLGLFLVVMVGTWLIVMVVLPQLFMIDLSFRPRLPLAQMGGPRDIYTLQNYRYLLFGSTVSTESWNAVHLRALGLTIVSAMLITLFNLVLCYPLAYYMGQVAGPRGLRLLLLLLIAPYWLNDILRAFAFRILFAESGLLNAMLLGAGLLDRPIDFIGQNIALYACLTYAYMLLMLFPLYNALEAFEHSQAEAARDLGAPWWHIHLFVVVPAVKGGIASGCTLVFMLATGALAAPLVLSGTSVLWFTPIVYDRFYQVFNWPQGAAYAFALLAICIILVIALLRRLRLSLTDVVR